MTRSVGLLLALAVVAAVFYARGALQVGVGYSAKQLCSGFFVAGMEAELVAQRDILPRLAVLGPLRGQLRLDIDREAGLATVGLLGVDATAVHQPERGCTLHASGPGVSPLAPAPAAPNVGVPEELASAFAAAFVEPQAPAGVDVQSGRNTLAVLLAVGGELVAERYAPVVTPQTRLQSWSMNKSLMATWIGMQADRGLLDPTASAYSLIDERGQGLSLDPTLTLLHLLQMESGLDFDETYGPGGDVTRMLYQTPTMWLEPARSGQQFAPGTHFSYSSGDTVFASYLWGQSLGRPYHDWIDTEFSAPLGLRSLIAEADVAGTQVGSSYVYMTAQDWLRVGQFWLDAYHGRAPLLSRDWLRDSVRPRPSDPEGRYGRGFWLNTGGGAFPNMPEELFYASGNSGQFVVVIPQWELVLVRLGLTTDGVSSGTGALLNSLVETLGLTQ